MSDVTSTSVKLSWSHPNPDDIQYYTISHKPRSASQSPGVISGVVTMYYTIRPLSPYTQYEFTISAVNGFGHGPPSPPIVATTGETGNITLSKLSCPTPPKIKTTTYFFQNFIILLYFITVLCPPVVVVVRDLRDKLWSFKRQLFSERDRCGNWIAGARDCRDCIIYVKNHLVFRNNYGHCYVVLIIILYLLTFFLYHILVIVKLFLLILFIFYRVCTKTWAVV